MAEAAPSTGEQLGELYHSLPFPTERSIRVLDLLPGRQRVDIRVSLRVVELSDDSEFEALSYTWGESAAGRSVLVNEKYRLPVIDNLFNALKRLRHRRCARTLWVDRITINQNDVDERNQQVALMGKIYAGARSVDVWLGEPGSWTFPLSISELALSPLYALIYFINIITTRTSSFYVHPRAVRDCVLQRNKIIEKALQNTKPRWPTRAWVVQEFLLAKKVFICCGPLRMPWDDLWFLDFYREIDHSTWSEVKMIRGMRYFWDAQFKLRDSSIDQRHKNAFLTAHRDLYAALVHLQKSNATDPLDYVYSLLGIIDKKEADLIRRDYRLKCADVFADATYASIQFRRNFDIFDHVLSPPQRRSGLPSWSADFSTRVDPKDWSIPTEYNPLQGVSLPVKFLPFRDVSICRSSRRLTLSANLVDRVVNVFCLCDIGALPTNNELAPEKQEHLQTLIRDAAARFTIAKSTSAMAGIIERFICPPVDHSAGAYISPRYQERSMLSRYLIGWSSNKVPHWPGTDAALRAFALWNGFLNTQPAFDRSKETDPCILESVLQDSLCTRPPDLFEDGCLFSTADGLVGIARNSIKRNDLIVHICSQHPFVAFRPHEDCCTFQGQIWMHGLMDEEVISEWISTGVEQSTFTLS